MLSPRRAAIERCSGSQHAHANDDEDCREDRPQHLSGTRASRTIGRQYCGGTPVQAVHRASLPIGMPMPPAPRSPKPRMRSPSVTGHHDKAHILFGPVLENVADPATRGDRQIDAPRLAEDMGELLARLTDRRRIDQWHIGGGVRHQHRVEQGTIPCTNLGSLPAYPREMPGSHRLPVALASDSSCKVCDHQVEPNSAELAKKKRSSTKSYS